MYTIYDVIYLDAAGAALGGYRVLARRHIEAAKLAGSPAPFLAVSGRPGEHLGDLRKAKRTEVKVYERIGQRLLPAADRTARRLLRGKKAVSGQPPPSPRMRGE